MDDMIQMDNEFVPWRSLENNPDVLNNMIYDMGVSRSLEFNDLYSIDDPDLLAFIPQPVVALLIVFPVSAEKSLDNKESNFTQNENQIIWMKQLAQNSCGTVGIVHAILNGVPDQYFEPNSLAAKFAQDFKNLDGNQRGIYLAKSKEMLNVHEKYATQGQSDVPGEGDDTILHYICLCKGKNGNLYELDGRMSGPIDHGYLDNENLLCPKTLGIIKEHMKDDISLAVSTLSIIE